MSAQRLIDRQPMTDAETAYRDQIAQLARCMATGQVENLRNQIDGPSSFQRLVEFVDGSFAKRMDYLSRMDEFVAAAFPNWDELLETYVFEQPLAAVAVGVEDADAVLAWLQATQDLTSEQQDYVTCERARHSVEAQALRNRLGHLRFQEIASLAQRFGEELQSDPRAAETLQITINPIRAWVSVRTRKLLGNNSDSPVDVVFFAVGEGINTVELSQEARDMFLELCNYAPCTLESWDTLDSRNRREQLTDLCVQLARVGLIAFS